LDVAKQPIKAVTPDVMQHIKDVICDTFTPSSVSSVPYNFGDAAAGTLKADEWWTLFTIYIPIALVTAISIACLHIMTHECASAYQAYIAAWLHKLRTIYPNVDDRTNDHMAFHIYDFLLLFSPVHS
jgi:hypothetical protein